VAINDLLPPKAARRCAIAKVKWFWEPVDTNNLISMVSFTFAMRRHLIWLASVPFRLAKLGLVPFADNEAEW